MKRIILISGLLNFSVLAATDTPQFFIGVKGGYQQALDDTYNHSEPHGNIFGVYGGLQFSPTWRWDIGYQFHDDLEADTTSISVNTWLVESALRYDWYLQDNLSLYGRLGAAYWNIEKSVSALIESDATGFSPLGEIGVSYNLRSNLNLSAGYQYINGIGDSNTGQYDSHAAMLSIAYNFGRSTQSEPISSEPVVESAELIKESAAKPKPQTRVFSAKTTEGFWALDSIEISEVFAQSLTKVADVLNSYPQAQAMIVAHTDSTGSEPYNQSLSERRAQAVANKLIELGVLPSQLQWQGKGETQPITDNNTANGRAKNRRVEITVLGFQFQE